jgi:hypothetical protein
MSQQANLYIKNEECYYVDSLNPSAKEVRSADILERGRSYSYHTVFFAKSQKLITISWLYVLTNNLRQTKRYGTKIM